MNEGQTNSCVACTAHGNQCTFLEDPRPRKRRLDSEGKIAESGKRRSAIVAMGTLCDRILLTARIGPSRTRNPRAIPVVQSKSSRRSQEDQQHCAWKRQQTAGNIRAHIWATPLS